jgi:hypothetical protein
MTRKRIVTGFDAQGKSVIVSDDPWPGQWDRGENDYYDDLWIFGGVPTLFDVAETTATDSFRLVPEGQRDRGARRDAPAAFRTGEAVR